MLEASDLGFWVRLKVLLRLGPNTAWRNLLGWILMVVDRRLTAAQGWFVDETLRIEQRYRTERYEETMAALKVRQEQTQLVGHAYGKGDEFHVGQTAPTLSSVLKEMREAHAAANASETSVSET
jgi:hypothetical protein